MAMQTEGTFAQASIQVCKIIHIFEYLNPRQLTIFFVMNATLEKKITNCGIEQRPTQNHQHPSAQKRKCCSALLNRSSQRNWSNSHFLMRLINKVSRTKGSLLWCKLIFRKGFKAEFSDLKVIFHIESTQNLNWNYLLTFTFNRITKTFYQITYLKTVI